MLRRLAVPALILVLAACAKREGATADDRYLTSEVSAGPIESSVLATGVLQPRAVVAVGAQVTGQVQQLNVELGQNVKAGQLIAVIEPATQKATLQNAQASVSAQAARVALAEATLAKARLDLSRQRQLADRGFASPAAVDATQATVDIDIAARNQEIAILQGARVGVGRAQVDLARTQITAPIDGVVAAVLVKTGQTVNAALSAPVLVRIAAADTMTVKVQVSEADIGRIRPGMVASFTVLGQPGRRYSGALRGIEPAPEGANEMLLAPANQPVYYDALFDVANPDGLLRPSMTAQVRIPTGDKRSVVRVATAALGQPDTHGAYTVKVLDKAGRIAPRQVRIGVRGDVDSEVLSGLAPHDKVVLGDAWDARTAPVTKGEH
ncbi:efflux RND transporter periplasmic adaptor subunit [Caulobacter sp. 1776]|uniref:efflux RND transporter periplasmic adaptor subunit n=1 Tax=Caulobacter sp. 1776 TaxID=3156420 RepID=UPI003394B121